MNKGYPTNLTDNQWQILEKILDPTRRKRINPLRDIVNAMLYLIITGCQWRMIPKDFPPYNTVYYYFRKWKNEGALEDIYINSCFIPPLFQNEKVILHQMLSLLQPQLSSIPPVEQLIGNLQLQ